jgi:pimeloyl-ACP methyl ester carboxylesterase/predicted acylesterase/phospholipase RssA
MPIFQRDNIRIRYEEIGSGFPLLVTPGGGLNSRVGNWQTAVFNAMEAFKSDFRCITMDQRNANGGESTGPLAVDNPWDAFADDQLGLMDHLGIREFLYMGYCIGGCFAGKLMQRAPERVIAAVLCQTVGHRPDDPDVMLRHSKENWVPDFVKGRPDVSAEAIEKYLQNLYAAQPDFLYSVSRDFIAQCRTPMLVLPDDTPSHPLQTSIDVASLAPKAEITVFPWKESEPLKQRTIERVRHFFQAVTRPRQRPVQGQKRIRHRENKAQKSRANIAKAESDARTALVLGGGAPNMALMAGAVAAFADHEITFDVVSTSGAGSLAGLLWLAPKGQPAAAALRSVMTMSVTDHIYQYLPVNYKVFQKPGLFADYWRSFLASNPLFSAKPEMYQDSPLYALYADWMALASATWSPSGLTGMSWGLCAPPPFLEQIIEFEKIKNIDAHFYVNAYNLTKETIVDFEKCEITPNHLRASLAFPFIYGPFQLGGDWYYEGAVVDCLNFKDLTERHTGLKTIVVFDVLGTDTLIRKPRNLYDSWVLSMIIPLVKTAEDNLELFALKHNLGWERRLGAKADILKIEFDVPTDHLVEVLDWSASNATRLFDIGYKACEGFIAKHRDKL